MTYNPEIPTYIPIIPWPPLVTSGTGIQSYQDPNGDWWVAKNGVYSGNWYRPQDVLRAKIYRAAAVNTSQGAQVVYDTAASDAYGMMASGGITAPIAGSYFVSGGFTYTASAAAQAVCACIQKPLGTILSIGQVSLSSASGNVMKGAVSDIIQCSAGDIVYIAQQFCTSSLAMYGVGTTSWVAMSMQLLGTL